MRARLAIAYCLPEQHFELREVVLRDKPASMLQISPKATVPVAQLESGEVIEESLDIMRYALSQNPHKAEELLPASIQTEILDLIAENDGDFKWALDRYKYSDRYEESPLFYREKGEAFLNQLNNRLQQHPYLMGDTVTLADLAITPFVRQFAHVDKAWFDASQYHHLVKWLDDWLSSALFTRIMAKYPQWHEGDEITYFP